MKVLYYNYFLFYSNVIKEDDPHFFTAFALSFSNSLYAIFIIDIILYNVSNIFLNKYINITVFISFAMIFHFYFVRKKIGIKVVESKPKFWNSQSTSQIVAFIFWLISVSLLFIHPMIFKFYIKCAEFKWF